MTQNATQDSTEMQFGPIWIFTHFLPFRSAYLPLLLKTCSW